MVVRLAQSIRTNSGGIRMVASIRLIKVKSRSSSLRMYPCTKWIFRILDLSRQPNCRPADLETSLSLPDAWLRCHRRLCRTSKSTRSLLNSISQGKECRRTSMSNQMRVCNHSLTSILTRLIVIQQPRCMNHQLITISELRLRRRMLRPSKCCLHPRRSCLRFRRSHLHPLRFSTSWLHSLHLSRSWLHLRRLSRSWLQSCRLSKS